MFDSLFQDLRYGLRSLTARPAFTIAALLTLALAIGANTLVFSLIDGIYLTPLPYRDDAALVDVENRYPNMGLDATGKIGAETARPWGKVLEMSNEIVERVDDLWSRLGLDAIK